MEDTLAQQRSRTNRILALGAGVVVHMLVCWAVFAMGFMAIEPAQFFGLVSLAVAGFVVFVLFVFMEWNLTLEDPDMSLPQMLWAVAVVLMTSHFVADMKAVVILSGLAMIVVGANRLSGKELAMFAAFSVATYALSLALRAQDSEIAWVAEGLMMVAFCLVLVFGPLLYRYEMALVERVLLEKNEQLNTALRQIQDLATKDELTGAFNRRHLLDVLQQQKAMADRRDYTFSVCFVDLDFLKKVNDRFGHATGDFVLRGFADVATSILREVDCVARLGGEEFVLVLAGTSERDAQAASMRIAAKLSNLQISAAEPTYRITASMGIAEYRSPEEFQATMERADRALYDAKRTGRNKVVVAEKESEFKLA